MAKVLAAAQRSPSCKFVLRKQKSVGEEGGEASGHVFRGTVEDLGMCSLGKTRFGGGRGRKGRRRERPAGFRREHDPALGGEVTA